MNQLSEGARQAIEQIGSVEHFEEVRIASEPLHYYQFLICFTSAGKVAAYQGKVCQCFRTVDDSDYDDHDIQCFNNVLGELKSLGLNYFHSPFLKSEEQPTDSFKTRNFRDLIQSIGLMIID